MFIVAVLEHLEQHEFAASVERINNVYDASFCRMFLPYSEFITIRLQFGRRSATIVVIAILVVIGGFMLVRSSDLVIRRLC